MNIIVSSVLSACGGALFAILVLGVKRIRGLVEVVKALSHDALFTRCEQHIAKGEITSSELENLTILYKAYTDQGLNGTGTELYNRAKALPLRQM